MISVPKIGEDLRSADLAFAALAEEVKNEAIAVGRRDAFNQVLKWATANQDALKRSGLAESLLRLCGI